MHSDHSSKGHALPQSIYKVVNGLTKGHALPQIMCKAAMRSKHRSKGRAMPGWGNVTNPEDWKVVDEAAHDTPGPQGQWRHAYNLGPTINGCDVYSLCQTKVCGCG
eukprot:1138747-Pelagomonas_calceolata.AAC.3